MLLNGHRLIQNQDCFAQLIQIYFAYLIQIRFAHLIQIRFAHLIQILTVQNPTKAQAKLLYGRAAVGFLKVMKLSESPR